MPTVRLPAVAGRFYPRDSQTLRHRPQDLRRGRIPVGLVDAEQVLLHHGHPPDATPVPRAGPLSPTRIHRARIDSVDPGDDPPEPPLLGGPSPRPPLLG